ncbi:MAG: hypothetical protein KDJ25_07890, partial [Rhodoblastus sp.]|nr:hypothetical protein [Rhodoblastus sp.]
APDVLAHAAVDFVLGFCALRHVMSCSVAATGRRDARRKPPSDPRSFHRFGPKNDFFCPVEERALLYPIS